MGYRDEFYTAGNIIGITGRIGENPTVYFQNGHSFGHITQFHDIPENVGRETVYAHPEYSIGNEVIDGETLSVEKIGETAFHTSRSPFIPVGDLPAVQKSVLAKCIEKFRNRKALAAMSKAEREDLIYGPEIGGDNITKLSAHLH